ncbi:MAG TPA: histidine phosphatase family protein [Acidimicrobiales bacterium]|nr:histidine phosphatase family protein [Acidimicrobiales bacterium]
MTRLVLVRHGEAQSFVEGVIGGHQGCTGLSDLGRRQAAALRDRLARTGELSDATAIYTSTLPRAIETADVLSPAVGGHASRSSCELCELHVDERLDGRPFEQFSEWYDWPPTSNPYVGWTDGAEPWAEFVVRVGRELDRIVREHAGETIVVVCHGGVIGAALSVFAELPLRQPFRLHIANTSLTEWVLEPDPRGTERWTLSRFNDAAHLADV